MKKICLYPLVYLAALGLSPVAFADDAPPAPDAASSAPVSTLEIPLFQPIPMETCPSAALQVTPAAASTATTPATAASQTCVLDAGGIIGTDETSGFPIPTTQHLVAKINHLDALKLRFRPPVNINNIDGKFVMTVTFYHHYDDKNPTLYDPKNYDVVQYDVTDVSYKFLKKNEDGGWNETAPGIWQCYGDDMDSGAKGPENPKMRIKIKDPAGCNLLIEAKNKPASAPVATPADS